MARRKNAPESVKVKHGLAERLREIRTELFGERGGPDLARRLEIPVRTWYNYETGVTVPAEIILRIVELTSVEPVWLLRGEGPKFREKPAGPALHASSFDSTSVPALLRAALHRLEQEERRSALLNIVAPRDDRDEEAEDSDPFLVGADRVAMGPLTPDDGPTYLLARREWRDARRSSRHLRVSDDDMAPIVGEGAIVAFAEAEPVSESFDGKLVVAKVEGKELVRWFQYSGRYALLRAENPAASPPTILVDLSEAAGLAYHRVLWISTPH